MVMTTPDNNGSAIEKIYSTITKVAGRPISRSHSNRWLAGVCGGLGEAFGIDPNLIRVITAVGMIVLTPLFLVLYIGLAVVLPKG